MKSLILAIAIVVISSFSPIKAQSTGLEIGNKSPDISLPSPKGDTIRLSSFKGKIVLIDFWATWCAPCVQEQSELKRLYAKYKNSKFTNGNGFEIFGVSLDAKKPAWQDFVRKQNINWTQVSDLKFWRSPVAKTYNIQELPYNVLIDGKGIILGKNLHGADLENGITKYAVSKF